MYYGPKRKAGKMSCSKRKEWREKEEFHHDKNNLLTTQCGENTIGSLLPEKFFSCQMATEVHLQIDCQVAFDSSHGVGENESKGLSPQNAFIVLRGRVMFSSVQQNELF